MSPRVLERIRAAILDGHYDLTRHAIEEMAEDGLGILDIECAILQGSLTRVEKDDPRGPRYTVVGLAEGLQTEIGVVGRFMETGVLLIITVYERTEPSR
jgi:hypothetical protein